MYVIGRFAAETSCVQSPWTKQNVFNLGFLVSLDQNTKIKICHMVSSEHIEVIKGRLQFITTYVLVYEEASEDVSFDNDGAALDEDDESGLVEVGVRTDVTKSITEEVEELQQVVKSSSIFSFMLKPTSFLTQVFNKNKKAQEKLFGHMCNFGSRAEWINGIRAVSSYFDVETSNDQYHLLN